jgi:hypothetical protein
MKIILPFLMLLLYFTQALANEAQFSGTALSLALDDAVISDGVITEEILFTTYDGDLQAFPLYYDSENGWIYYSRELKKIDALYWTDFYFLSDSSVTDFGAVHLDLGNIDHDGNGLDDICEKSKSFNGLISGQWYSQDGISSGNISGSMVKNAGLQVGTYNLTIYNTGAGDLAVSSEFYTGLASGSAEYSVSDNSITIDYRVSFDYTSELNTIQTTYQIVNQDQVRINGVDFFPTTMFHRNGNTYSAEVTLPDGEELTSWPDFQKWSFNIVDDNDSDGDGIPDLSDKKVCLTFLPLLLK